MCMKTDYPSVSTSSSDAAGPAAAKEIRRGTVGSTGGHPLSLDDFYRCHPSFLWGPAVVSLCLYGLTHVHQLIPQLDGLHRYLAANAMQAWGWEAALHYTFFAVLLSYAFHGWCTVHAPHRLKVQKTKAYEVSPDAMAVRSTAAILTEVVYAFLPLAPATNRWWTFVLWTAAANLYWDAHFYFVHRYVHENKSAYKFFHKTHHLCKAPNCFGAYFVTYQSHVILEQVVVVGLALLGLPRNVFCFLMYWGTLATLVEHSGYELGSIQLPLVPLTFGQLESLMGLPTFFLPGVSVADHDWHHEKFFDNYALSYKHLDYLFGTYHVGRNQEVHHEDDSDMAAKHH